MIIIQKLAIHTPANARTAASTVEDARHLHALFLPGTSDTPHAYGPAIVVPFPLGGLAQRELRVTLTTLLSKRSTGRAFFYHLPDKHL